MVAVEAIYKLMRARLGLGLLFLFPLAFIVIGATLISTLVASANNPPPGANSVLTVTKTVQGSAPGQVFEITVTGATGVVSTTTIVAGQTITFAVPSGLYTVTETSPGAGWATTYNVTTGNGYVTPASAVVTLTNAPNAPTVASGTLITGTVYRDVNSDGRITANGVITETGVQSVTVTAYDRNGNVAGATTTAASGRYTLTTTAAGPWRVEFSDLPVGYEPSRSGLQNGTSVQFVSSTSEARNVNFGIARPTDFCQANPLLAMPAHLAGTGVGQTSLTNDFAMTYFPYNNPTNLQRTNVATLEQVGSLWGVAYQRESARVFSSAFLKRHVGVGPRGLDGVYVFDRNSPSLLGGFDLENVSPVNGGIINLGTVTRTNVAGAIANSSAGDYQLSADPGQASIDLDGFAKVGKVGYGDIDMAPDDQTLWMVNLNQRTLVKVDLDQVTVSNTNPNPVPAAAVSHYAIVTGTSGAPLITGAPTCSAGTLRPFGLKILDDIGYLGVVCDAATSGTRLQPSQLIAYVLSFDPANPTSFTTEVTIPMNYTREVAYQGNNNANETLSGVWQRWASSWSDFNNYGGTVTPNFRSAPQPILSDIEFADDGAMILGIADRGAHMGGSANYPAIPYSGGSRPGLINMITAGDTLRVPRVGDGWGSPEDGENDPGEPAWSGTAANRFLTNDSAGNHGEFFFGDIRFDEGANEADGHYEVTEGALAVLPGRNEMVSTVMDPILFFQQGTRWFNTTTGDRTRNYASFSTSFSDPARFGKGAGVGDLELLCDPAPIEIGNRVWNDTNANGIQDPGEPGLTGVAVTLTLPTGGSIATVTGIDGTYYFTREATTGAYSQTLRPNATYTISVGLTQAALNGFDLTAANADGLTTNDAIADVRDSDATAVNGLARIVYTTGGPGRNNHGLDFGFEQGSIGHVEIVNTPPPPDITHFKDFVAAIAQGDGTWNMLYRITVQNIGGSAGQYDLEDEPTFDDDLTLNSASFVSSAPSGNALAGSGPWTLADDVSLNAGASHIYTLTVNATLNLTAGSGGDNVYTACEAATPGNPEAGEGGFNESRLDTNNDGTPDEIDEACGDVPNIVHDKEFVSATAAAGDTWDVVYRIVVNNNGGTSGVYSLSDQPAFDDDIDINGASFASSVPSGSGLAGDGPWSLATNQSLNAGASHIYTLTVNVDMNLAGGIGDDSYDRCLPTPDGAPDQGLFNRATLTQPGQPGRDADACGDLPNIVHDKEFESATAAAGDTWDVVYRITVHNNGGASGVYTLSDQPAFDDDIDINSASFASTVPSGGPLAGDGPWSLATNQSLNAGASHVYTLTVNVGLNLAGGIGNDVYDRCLPTPDGAPDQGLFNRATLTQPGQPGRDADACGDLPNIVHDKEFVSATVAAGDTWDVVYRITVNNNGGASGVYTLSDQPAMDDDIDINSASFASTVPSGSGLAGDGPWSLATNQSLNAGASHVYTLTVNVDMDLAGGSGDDSYDRCQPTPDGAPDQGLFNRVTLTQPGQPGRDADACGDLPNIVHDKEFVSATAAAGDTWDVVYRITVNNNGGASGTYSLSDQPSFDDDIDINGASFASTVPSGSGLAGDGPWSLATNQSLNAGASHVYTLTVNVDMDLAGGSGDDSYDRCLPTPDGVPDQGLFNRVTLTQPGQPGRDADACGDLPNIVHDKEFVSATAAAGDTWDVVYRITVNNNGGASGTYSLSDQPAMDDDIDINSASFASTVPSNGALAGSGPWSLATNQSLASGASHIYTLTVNVGLNLAGGSGDDNYDRCLPTPDGAPDQGLFNRATLTQPGQPGRDADACGDLPNIVHDKEFVSATAAAGDTWDVVYRITVNNNGGASGTYSLSDQPSFDDDIDINGASFASTVPSGSGLAGDGPWSLATNQSLNAGASHIYTLTVNVDMDLAGGSGDDSYDRCLPTPDGAPDQGLFNRATLTQPGQPGRDADACGDLPNIVHDKEFVSATAAAGDTWDVVYRITVNNNGGASGVYSLSDQPAMDDDIDINSASFASTVPSGGPLAGDGPWALATNQSLNAGASHIYTLTVNVDMNLAGGIGDDNYDRCLPTPDGAPDQGLFNRVTLTQPGQPGRDADACGDIPSITHEKTFVGVTEQPDGTWNLVYRIDVLNNGGATGQYDLEDEPTFDDDLTLNSASFVSTVPSGGPLAGNGPWTLADDVSLAAGASHVYTLTVNATLDLSTGSGGDNTYTACETATPGNPEAGEGGFNESRLDTNNDGTPDEIDEACGDVPNITHEKTFVGVTEQPDGTWNLVYRIDVLNNGGATGEYDLEDEPTFDDDLTLNSAGFVSTVPSGGPLAGDGPWTLADDVSLAAGASHVYTLTVNATLNLSAGSGGDNTYTACETATPGNPEAGEGGFNESRLDTNNDGTPDEIDEACGDVPYLDLALRKTLAAGQAATVQAGDDVAYSIEVFNQGRRAATDVRVTDYIPAGMTLSPNAVGWTAVGNTAEITVPTLGVGQSTTLEIVLRVDGGFQGAQLINWAEISEDNGNDVDSVADNGNQNTVGEQPPQLEDNQIDENGLDGGDEDDHDPATVNVGQVYDLALRKTLAAGQAAAVQPGADVTYTIQVLNQGSLDAANVQVVDYIPAGMTLSPLASGWTDNGSTATRTVASLPAGQSVNLTIVLRIDPGFQGTALVNGVEITADNGDDIDSTPDNQDGNTPGEDANFKNDEVNEDGFAGGDEDDHDREPVTIVRPGITHDKTFVSVTAAAGNTWNLVYRITVVNNGGVTGEYDLEDEPTFDDDLTLNSAGFVSTVPSGGPLAGDGPWTLADDVSLAAGASHVYTLTVNATLDLSTGSGGDNTYTACETATPGNPEAGEGGFNESRLDTNNDGTPDEIDEACGDVPNITHEKTFVGVTEQPDGTWNLVYRIDVLNNGGATGEYDLEDEPTFDDDLTLNSAGFVSTVPSGGPLAGDGPWTLADDVSLAAGASHVYTLTVNATLNLSAGSGGDNTYTACETATPGNPEAGEGGFNESRLDTNNDGTPDEIDEACGDVPYLDLALRKTLAAGQAATVQAGDDVAYSIEVFNQGRRAATDVRVTDYIPAGMTLSPNAVGWTAVGNTAEITVPTLGVGQSTTLEIVLRVDGGFQGAQLINWAEISEDNGNDVDSVADNGNQNTVGEQPPQLEDNQIDENGLDGGDEDDHDPATVNVGQVYDLALRKTLAAGQAAAVQPGADVTYTIQVLNQGSLDAANVQVVDYIPAGMTLSPLASGWTDNGSTATRTVASLPAGQSVNLTIVLRIDPGFQGTALVNGVEITADNGDDIDSTPDNQDGNTPGEDANFKNDEVNEDGFAGGDEDDHDREPVTIVQPGLNHDKEFVSATAANGGWNVVYRITVNNTGTASGVYTLTDQPAMDDDVTINSASFVSSVPSNGALAGTGPWSLATNQSLAAGASHVYTLTVNVGLNLAGGGGNDVYDRCLPTPDGAPDQGLFNRATLTQPGQPGRDADACGDVPHIVHDKEFVSATAAAGDTWDVVYRIVATNNGGASGVYTLSDQPAMDNDVTINSASFVSTVPSNGALAGTGPWALATNQSLNAGASHVYTLTVNVGLNLAGGGGNDVYDRCLPTPDGAPNQGLFNRATLTQPGQPGRDADVCGDVPNIVHDKEFVSATAAAGDTWDVVYRITVNNNGGASGTYSLSDQPAMDNDVTINSAGFVSSVPSNGALAGTGPWTLATNQSLNAGASHVYTLTVNVDLNLAGGGGNDVYDRCLPTPDGAPNQGLFNRATLTQPGQPGRDADACGDVPNIVHDKEFVSATAVNGGWNVVYRITVNNNGGTSGVYTLSDQPSFDDDIDINSAGFASTVPSGSGLTGDGPWSLATNQSLNAGASHIYTLTVNVDMDLAGGSGDDDYDRCQPTPDGAPNQGLFNRVTLTQPGQPGRDADACGDLPNIVHDKEFVSATAANGGWNVVYRITVNNNGGASGVYTLTDQPAMDNDVTINSASFVSSVPSNGALNGSGPWSLATNQSLNAGASHVYTLTMNVGLNLAGGGGNDVYDRCLPTPDGAPNQGLFNRATLTQPGQPGRDADACGDVPNITHDKQFVSLTQVTGNTWSVVYRIIVTNGGGMPGQYDLSDQPAFDDDVAITGASFVSTVPSNGALAATPWVLANDVNLAAGASHIYTLTVGVRLDLSTGSSGDNIVTRCGTETPGDPQAGEGLFNESRLDLNNDGVPDEIDDVCENLNYMDLALRKRPAATNPPTLRPGDLVTFTVEVFNQGVLTATNIQVVDYIPAGAALSATTPGWTAQNGTASATIASLAPSQTATLTLALRIGASFQATSLTNYAEVAGQTGGQDIDSTPDSQNQNTPGEQPPALEDDQINENGQNGADEDDHDLATVAISQLADWGDLPARYPTTAANVGANHRIEPGVFLGARVDGEGDGQPSVGANGDDNNPAAGPDDEDGVLFLTPLTPGTTAQIRVTASISGFLNGWFDWNNNGLLESGERVFADAALNAGANTLNVNVPANANPEELYARFRFTTGRNQAIAPTGSAPNGEVEDYVLLSLGDTVFLDNGQGSGVPNDGKQTGDEPGVANVTVQLLSSQGAVLATTTTDAQGNYLFTGLPAGDYRVRVAAAEFQPGGDLAGLRSSTGAGIPNADLDQDVDENGVDDTNPAANGITSGVITLSPAGEPDAAVDGNGVNSNLTLDFGFVRYDLALRKSVSGYSETPLVPGVSKITFRIEVINQGDVAASNVTVVDYLQNGYTFDAADNPGWTGGANPTTVIAGPIQPGDIATVNLVLRLNAGTRGATLANFAEIANDGWPAGSDIDSTPDTQNQETPVKDDVIDEDGKNVPGEDEDDHDVAIVTVQVFDLALMKRVAFAPSPLVPGQSKVTFAIEVFNQGDITATNVLLTDYVQQGFTFSLADNPGWSAADPLKPTLLITGAIPPGRSAVVNVVLGTTADGARQVVNNFAEISDVDDTIVGNAPPIDVDSTPDNLNQESPVKDDVITEDGKNVPGQDEDDHDIASLRLPGVGIGGFVWADLDNSGTFQQGETTFDGVTVQLYRAGDTPGVSTPVASQVTTNGGNYLFTDLAPGRYFVYIPTPPAGHPLSSTPTDTADNQQKNDDNGIQPTVGGGTSSPVIDLQPGQEPLPEIDGTDINIDSTIDFGFLPPVSLGNLVWHDANDNGQRDNGEAGIDGVGVQLYRADQTPGVDAPVATTTTAGGGQYLFSNLTPGEYIVYIPTPPAAYPASSSVTDNADNGQDNDDNGAQATVGGPVTSPTITLTPGQEPTSEDGNANSDLTIDFGFYGPLSLGDIVWHDANNNGQRDNGETGIAGVNVQLFQAGQTPGVDNPVAVDVTDANGNYRFDGLRPGQYFVYMPTPPADYPTSSTPTSTADDNVNDDDNGVQASTGAPVTSAVVTLTSGAEPNENGMANLTIDFGFYRFDLALRKTVASLSSTPLAPGVSTITFTIAVFNQGDIQATNVTVVDYVPAGLVFEPALNPGWSGSPNPTTVIAGPIQPGQSATVQIVLRVAAGAAGQSIANAAEIANDNQPPGTDPDSRPDTQNQETPVKDDVIDEDAVTNPGVDDEDDHDIAVVTVDTFDLALRKRVVSQSDSPLAPGVSTVTFSIEVFNQGDVAASNVTVIDYVPAGLVFDPSINPGWSGSPNPTTVIAGPVQPGQSATVQIVLRVAVGTAGLTINNAAEIADDSTDGADVDSTPDTQNQETPVKDDVIDENALTNPGVDDEDDHDIAPITVGAFDLALRKQLIPGQHPTFQANDSVRFLIEVFNQGNITATNITIVDYIPAGFVLSSTAPVNAGWVVNGNVAQTTLPGPLAPGASITREIVLFVVEAAGVVTNYAEITGASDEDGTPTPDIDSTPDAINGNDPYVDDVIDDDGTIDEDDHDGAEITVDRFDMSLIKRLADGQEVQVQTGDDVEYTIQVRNEGSALVSEVLLIDYIPTGFILSPVDPYGWVASADGRTATNSIPGPIPPGGTASINILLRVTALEPATYINWAEILFVYDEEGNPHVDGDSTPNDDPGDDDIDGDGIPDEDDIDAAVVEIQKPTAITLSSFTANFAGGVIRVLWTTTLELDTVGFHLYRSTSGGLNDAVRITPALIPGQGSDGGAYSFTDTRITAGVTYWYWLVETETTGTINYYGPVRATAIQGYDPEGRMGIFLPIISR
jgi:uncharacterized repeat protein (TIGR01451 family)